MLTNQMRIASEMLPMGLKMRRVVIHTMRQEDHARPHRAATLSIWQLIRACKSVCKIQNPALSLHFSS